jgi:CBS domain-containing protein
VTPDEPGPAVQVMAEKDIGSLVVMEHGDLVGMLTFREVIQAMVKNGGVGTMRVRSPWTTRP